MLDYVRKRANSPAVKLGAGLIALTFFIGFGILTGIRRTSKMGSGVVAEVNGEKIYLQDYNLLLSRYVEIYRKKFGNKFDEALMKKIHFREQILYGMIIQLLKSKEAVELGMDVDDQTLAERIASIPAFQYGGRFNQRLYERVLRDSRPPLTPAEFEKEEKIQLGSVRFDNLVQNTWFIENEELFELYYAENEKINLYYVKFTPQQFIPRERVSLREAENYYTQHKDEFKTGELRKTEYVYIPLIPGQNEITEKMIKDYYNQHQDEFQHGEEVKARHILIKVSPNASTEEVEKAKKKALKILALAKKGFNFAKLAKKYSEGPSASRGGELGWFGRGEMVRSFEDAAFNTASGEITGPVRSQFGFHIIKVEGKRGEGISPLSEVKTRIKFELSQKILEKKKKEISDAFKETKKTGDLKSLAARFGAKVKETNYFDKEHIVPKNVPDPTFFRDKVFAQKDISKPFKFDTFSGAYIVKVNGEKPPYQQTFPEVKDKITEKLKMNKAKLKAAAEASRFLSLMEKYNNIKKAAKRMHLKVEETGEFTPSSPSIPGIGKNLELWQSAFRLSEKNPFPKKVFTVENNFFVIALKEHKKVNAKDFRKNKDRVEKKFREKVSEKLEEKWLRYLQEKGEITIHKEAILPPGQQS